MGNLTLMIATMTMLLPCSTNLHEIKPSSLAWQSRFYTVPVPRTLQVPFSTNVVCTPLFSHALCFLILASFFKLSWLLENVLPLSAQQKSYPSQSSVHLLLLCKAFPSHPGQQGSLSTLTSIAVLSENSQNPLHELHYVDYFVYEKPGYSQREGPCLILWHLASASKNKKFVGKQSVKYK